MGLSCPVCKAENTAGPACRRCKADLELLWICERYRTQLLRQAKSACCEDRLDDALELARRAERIRRGHDVAAVQAIAFLLAGDYEGAVQAHAVAAAMPVT